MQQEQSWCRGHGEDGPGHRGDLARTSDAIEQGRGAVQRQVGLRSGSWVISSAPRHIRSVMWRSRRE